MIYLMYTYTTKSSLDRLQKRCCGNENLGFTNVMTLIIKLFVYIVGVVRY